MNREKVQQADGADGGRERRVSLSIIIPAFNEEARLGRTLETYASALDRTTGVEGEILVVANACVDRTAEIARAAAARHPAIRVFEDPRKIGKGGAILRGMDEARGERIGFVDADGATPPESFFAMVERIERGDAGLVIANRWHPDSRITPQPWRRRVISRIFNILVRLLFGVRTSDTQCGAKLWTRDTQRAIRPCIGITRWAFDVDLLFQARRAGVRTAEIPAVWNDQSGSRLRLVRGSWEMFLAVVRLRLLYSPLRFLVRVYDITLGRFTHPVPDADKSHCAGTPER